MPGSAHNPCLICRHILKPRKQILEWLLPVQVCCTRIWDSRFTYRLKPGCSKGRYIVGKCREHSPGPDTGKATLLLSHLRPSNAAKPKTLQIGLGKLLQLMQQTAIPKALQEPGRTISPNTMMAQRCILKFWLRFTQESPTADTTSISFHTTKIPPLPRL